ncbi:MAG: hypothetical protein QN183_01410 [Armatimonadota bacterium]|nr:hypothetical protein [Armatimonadota bacterium]MDR7535009.1 hypothetical protein [Armatimonadota bacterium]
MGQDMIEELRLRPPRIDATLILRLHKYRRPERVAPQLREVARRMAAQAETLLEPRGWLRRARVHGVDPQGAVLLDDGVAFHSQALARRLDGAAEVVLLVLTIGSALERRAQALMREEHVVEGLLLDTGGWVAIDALLRDVRQRLAADARRRGYRLTARLAPGFAGWPLEQQRALFDAFGEGLVAVRLTDHCVMRPGKSVSGLYGLVAAGRP